MITLSHMPRTSGPGRGPKGRGRRQPAPPLTSVEELRSWFAGSIPDDWFAEPVSVDFDRDEVVVRGTLPLPKLADGDDGQLAAAARIKAFREDTREQRIAIAQRAEQAFERSISWEATCGDQDASFTRASVPVMTRLHLEDRQVLDTLIDAGVARSRSEAMAWCVRLVAENESSWMDDLRSALTDVETVRHQGPTTRRPQGGNAS
jgi:hypothetical protein